MKELVHYLAYGDECVEAETDDGTNLALPFSYPTTIQVRHDGESARLGSWHRPGGCTRRVRRFLDPSEWPGGRIPEKVALVHGVPEDARGEEPVANRPETFLEAFAKDLEVGLARPDRKLEPKEVAEGIRLADQNGWALAYASDPTLGDLIPVGVFTAVRDQDAMQVAFGALPMEEVRGLLATQTSTHFAVAARRAARDSATIPKDVALAWTDLILGPRPAPGSVREERPSRNEYVAPAFRVASAERDGEFEAENQDRFVTVGPWRVDLPAVIRRAKTRDEACQAVLAELRAIVERSLSEQSGEEWTF